MPAPLCRVLLQGKKAKNKIPAPKFTVAAPQPKQQQHQQQQRKGSTATKMAAQRQQQQQQQQGRRSKQPIQAPQQQVLESGGCVEGRSACVSATAASMHHSLMLMCKC